VTEFERRTPRFDRIVPTDARVEHLACGFTFTEGPLWTGDSLLFSDIPNSRIVRWRMSLAGAELTTFRCPSNLANGLTFDREGRLLACEGAARRLTRTEPDGRVITVAETYDGRRINSPNDVVVASDGSVYFSDPAWGHGFANPYGPRVREADYALSFQGVFRLGSDGALAPVADDFERPNGLAFSPDGRTLYVDDTRRFHIRAFDMRPDGTLTNSRVFAELRADEPGVPDGMKVDVEGNIYCTGPGGTWVVAPTGEILGRIITPEIPANVAWGETDWQTLYITARTGLYRVRLSIPGVPVR
jgi:gluconolactonase